MNNCLLPSEVFDIKVVSEGASGAEKGYSELHSAPTIVGRGASSPERASEAQRRLEETGTPVAAGPSEGREPRQQQDKNTRAAEKTAFHPSARTLRSPAQQQSHQQEQQQQSRHAQLSNRTKGVFIAFKQLTDAAAAGAAVAAKKRFAAPSRSGLHSPTQRQQGELGQLKLLLQQPLLPLLSKSLPPSNGSKHRREIHAAAGAGGDVAGTPVAASADASAATVPADASGPTSGARPTTNSGAGGLLETETWPQREDKTLPSAARSWGSSAVWLMQWCYPLTSCIATETRERHAITAALSGEAASAAISAARCHCVVSRMRVLLRDGPLQKLQSEQQQEQQLKQGGARVIPVFQQQQLLLACCAEGSYPPQLVGALRLQLQHRLFRPAGAKRDQAFALATLAHGHPSNEEQGWQNPAAARYEATAPNTSEDTAETTPQRAVGAEPTGVTADLPPISLASYGTEQQKHELHLRQEEGQQYVGLSSPSDGELEGQQKKQGTKSEVGRNQLLKINQQEQQRIYQQGEQQQRELSSRWGRQLVSWSWRRSCMRQRQPAKPEAAAAAEAATVAAAALCYRPPEPTSLALQVVLSLFPHDIAVRLLANTNTAQCQQPQQQKQLHRASRQQVEPEQQEQLFWRGELRKHAVLHEPHHGSCAAPPNLLSSGKSCVVPFEDPGWPAFELAGTTDEAGQQQEAIDRMKTHEVRFELLPEKQQKQEQPSGQQAKQQPATQQQQAAGGPLQEVQELQQDGGCQQPREWQQGAQSVTDGQRDGQLEQGQLHAEKLMEQQQQQQAGSSVAISAAAAASATAELHANSQGPSTTSAVGGVPGAPQLYGRGFVQGEQLPASFLRLHFNFASVDAGARIIASSPGVQHIKAVQRPDADTYMLVPCYVPSKYFVLSFSETLKIDFVVIQSFEIYANAFWHIQLLGADTYPTRQWRLIANLQTAADVSSELFDLKSECAALSSCWAKFLKVRLLTHHDEGPHYYCSLTSFQVFGATGVQFLETQIHDEFGEAAHGTEEEVSEEVPSSGGPPPVSASAVNAASDGPSATFARKDSRVTGMEASLPPIDPDHSGSLEEIKQHLGARQSVPFGSNGPQELQKHAREGGATAQMPQQLDEVQGRRAKAASVERLASRNPVPMDATAASEAEGLHIRSEKAGADDKRGEAPFLHGERQRRVVSAGRQGNPLLDAHTDGAALAAASADPDTEIATQRVSQQQQQQLPNLSRVEDAEKQGAAALNTLSDALEKALQHQQQLLKQKRQRQQQEHLDLQHDAVIDDHPWAEMRYPSVSIPGFREVLGFRSSLTDSAVCTTSSSSTAKSVWQGPNPLIQPTTSRYICIPLAEGMSMTGAAAADAPANTPGAAHQVHLVAANASPRKSSKQLQVADAATETLRQAAAYARAFLLDALQHNQQQPQLQQSPIGAAFLRFLMTTTPGAQDQQAETLRVLSLLLQPPSVDVSSNGGGVSGEATRGGMAAAAPLGPRDTKGEHVLVMLLERMKSLEGETAAFKAAAAERQQQLQLQQQHLLHLALLVQLQQQLGSFLFERLAAFDGLIPHLSPLVQLLDESEAAATSAAAAAQEEKVLHGTVAAAAEQHLDPHCSMVDGKNKGRNSSGQQKEQQRQQQHCRRTGRHHSWGWPWDALKRHLLRSLEWVWRWLALPLMHWGSGIIYSARVAAQLLQQTFCSEAESAVVQQSCATASNLYVGLTSVAGTVAYGATMGADIAWRGICVVAEFVAATWNGLFAALDQGPPVSHDWSTGSSSSSDHWTGRFLLLQERGSLQAADSSAATPLLLLLVCFLAVSGACFWRLRRGQRVAAAAAGECALLRRSFELLQQQHQALVHQLQQYKREQQLLLLLTASHHSGNSSRMLLHRTKYETYETHVQKRQQKDVRLSDPVKPDLPADIVQTAAVHQNTIFAEAPEPLASPLRSQAPDTTPSLLRRLSTSLAPRVFLGLSRNAGDRSRMTPEDYGNSSNNSSNASGENAPASQSPRRDSDAVLPQLREAVLQQQGGSCGPHEQQTQQEQQVQFATAALLPALDTKAIRSLKLQRHTLRQRRQGGATTPVASPSGVAVAEGETLLLSPSGIGAGVSVHTQNAYVSSGAEAAVVTTSSAAPSRSSSSRSSSVCSTSGNLQGVANSYLKSLWASQLARSGTVPHVSLLLQSTQRQMESNRALRHRDSRDLEVRASSNLSSSSSGGISSACAGSSSVAAAIAASQGRSLSCNMPMSIPVAGRRMAGDELADQDGTGAEGALPVAYGESNTPGVATRTELTGESVYLGANQDGVMAHAFAFGPSAQLEQTRPLQPQHLQAAAAPTAGRDGRRRRKKRGAS
ncbi:hypothetical protein, conserved [Eimeria praecox]|uniref:SUN domain-containing protein n=1 Tax=Eimeria praecox TaxID=51316 RepID=U6H0G8_9EIME|nr:hypothetical protein, conserved [Eimeria praecox]